MKKLFCALIAALMIIPAFAETAETSAPAAEIQLITPTPSAEPLGTVYSSEDLIVTLPHGLRILEAGELEGYEAAVQVNYPEAARTILVAANADFTSLLSFSVSGITGDAASAAREAAEKILGKADSVKEETHGTNAYASFACAIDDQRYDLYYLSGGAQMLVIGAAGVDEAQLNNMLAGIIF